MFQYEKIHGYALVTLAICIPIGEGITFIAGACLALCLFLQRSYMYTAALYQGTCKYVMQGLVGWLVGGCLAIALSGEGWLKPTELGRWLPLLLIPCTVLSCRFLPAYWFKRAVVGFIASLTLGCIFALLQFYFNIRPFEYLIRDGHIATSQSRIPGNEALTVAGGFYMHRLKMAHVSLVGISVMIARQLFAKISVHHRIAELFILALFGITLLLTYSRAAFLGLLAGVLVLCIICSTWRLRLLGGLLIVCVITLALLIPQVQQRLLSIGDSHTATDRAVIWSQGIQVIADHPFGVGFGNYSKIIGRYYDNINANITVRTYPHHIVLAVWAETGPIGLISFLFAWASLLHACLRRLKQHHATNHTTAAAGCMLIVAYYTVGLTHDILYHNAVALAFSAAMGAVLARLDES